MANASRKLREALEHQLGPENTDELLSLMPPDWTQLATKQDLALLGADLRGEMAGLRGELRAEMADLRGELRAEMADLRGELRAEMADLRGEFKADMGQLRGEFGTLRGEFGELKATLHSQLRTQTYLLLGAMTGLASLVIALR